ncbi:MAG TPA: hypothetical protein VI112_09875 [Bacteroidia bacterium]|jgi:hypothetical protein
MNKQLYDTYKKLGETVKSEIRFRLKDSPVGLSFMDFLEQCANRNFHNRDVVEHIYKEELESKPYAVLENRYFKLRKKFADEYLVANEDANVFLPDEEQELQRCRQLISNNEKETAYQRLSELEKICWQKNIFELLPAIIDQLIFCNQAFNRLDRNERLFGRLEDAIQLEADIKRCIMLARKVYEINYRSGVKHARKELEAMKDLAMKHVKYPRFNMCYHHVSLYYKLGSTDYVNDMQVISRHYAQFRKLHEQYPLLPLIAYRVNYIQYQHFHFRQIQVFYHFNRCEFEEAYAAMKEAWEMTEAEENIFRVYKSESLYFNLISAQLATERYAEADMTADRYIAFLKQNDQSGKMPYAYTQKAMIWAAAFPKIKSEQVDFFLKRIEEYQRTLKKQDNIQLSWAESEALRAKIFFIQRRYEKALAMLKSEEVKKFYESLGLYQLFGELYSLYRSPSRERKEELKRKISAKRYTTKAPNIMMQLRWLQNMVGQV